MAEGVLGGATISKDGRYRYTLHRDWRRDGPGGRDLWIMCNPSTADWAADDPTVVRCMGFSRRNGASGLVIVNPYAFRTPSPKALWAAERDGTDIVGPDNDGWIRAHLAVVTGKVIVAWGAHPKPERIVAVMCMIAEARRRPMCLGMTKAGQPRHPLMLRSDTPLVPWVQPPGPRGPSPSYVIMDETVAFDG